MTLDLLTKNPVRQTTRTHAHELGPVIEAEIPCAEIVEIRGQITCETRLLEYIDNLSPYALALAAMPLIDDRIKFSSFTTAKGQPIENLREWIRAVEAGEWPG